MYVSAKMKPAETTAVIGGEGYKGVWWEGEFM
jgi:hypothetical protein